MVKGDSCDGVGDEELAVLDVVYPPMPPVLRAATGTRQGVSLRRR